MSQLISAAKSIASVLFAFCLYGTFMVVTLGPWLVSIISNAKRDNYLSIIFFDLALPPLGWLHGVYLILF